MKRDFLSCARNKVVGTNEVDDLRTPAIRVNYEKILFNAHNLKKFYGDKGIQLVTVLKAVSGDEVIAKMLLEQGFNFLGDTNINNLKRFKEISDQVECMMLRTPALSEIEDVIRFADISLNSEKEVIQALSVEAVKLNKVHDIILMVELGDMREGILPVNLIQFIENIIVLKNIKIVGIGSNFACFNNRIPSDATMKQLSELADLVEMTFDIKLKWVSGGNSANYDWVMNTNETYRINQIRLGESILCGINPLGNKIIPGLFQDAFTLLLEVVESKLKGSHLSKENKHKRILMNIGKQDALISGLSTKHKLKIVNHSSNHLAAMTIDQDIKLGSLISFSMNYDAMVTSMTSPNVFKYYVKNDSEVC